MAIGYTFSPSTDRRGANGERTEPVQQPQGAIQTLDYSLPKFTGNAPSPLVSKTPVGSPFSSAVLASVFKTVLGADADPSSFGSPASAGPSASPIAAPSRDTGISSYAASTVPSLPRPSAPQTLPTMPSAPPAQNVPQFEGYVDTPPGGGFGNMWESLTGDDEQRRRYLDWVSQMAAMQPPKPPSTGLPSNWIVENPPSGGGGTRA